MKNKTKIFVIYHRPETTIYSDVYQPICVGDNKDDFDKFYLRDDVGDNIAEKNYIFNELTAIYWVYKHIDEFKDYDHFGFCHYRRFFAFTKQLKNVKRKRHTLSGQKKESTKPRRIFLFRFELISQCVFTLAFTISIEKNFYIYTVTI